MILSAIAAMDENRIIGKNGDLPWHIPEDFQFFRTKTTGHIMVMGRKTFDSFGGKPLPKRLHVVITRQKDYRPEGAHVFHDVESALDFCQSQTEGKPGAPAPWPEEVFIIGGGEIYSATLNVTDRIYLTEIHKAYEGDAKFPVFSKVDFQETERRSSQDNGVSYDFVTYQRRRLIAR